MKLVGFREQEKGISKREKNKNIKDLHKAINEFKKSYQRRTQ